MRDRSGQTYRESKSFVIASKTPTVQIKLPKTANRRGELLGLKVPRRRTPDACGAPGRCRTREFAVGREGRGKYRELFIPDQMIPEPSLTVRGRYRAHNGFLESSDRE